MPVERIETEASADPDEWYTLDDVQARLDREAALLDEAHGGTHRFNNVRSFSEINGVNWTANFGRRGGSSSLAESVQLSGMREVLKRVQAEMPRIRFERTPGSRH